MEPQATADISRRAVTAHAKRRFNFQEIPSVHAESHDRSSPLAFLKSFISDELVENIVNFTNKYAVIIINDPKTIVSSISGKNHW